MSFSAYVLADDTSKVTSVYDQTILAPGTAFNDN